MTTIDPWVLLALNCCGLPLVGAVLGCIVTLIIVRGYRIRIEHE